MMMKKNIKFEKERKTDDELDKENCYERKGYVYGYDYKKEIGKKYWVVRLETLNSRGINGKEDELTEEREKIKLHYVEITKIKRKGRGCKTLPSGYCMYWFGLKEENNARAGVALLIKEEQTKNIRKANFKNEGILSISIKESVENDEYTLMMWYGSNDYARTEDNRFKR